MADGFHRIMAAVRNGFIDIAPHQKKYPQDAQFMRWGRMSPWSPAHQCRQMSLKIALKEFPIGATGGLRRLAGVKPIRIKIHNELLTVNTSTPTNGIGKDGKQYRQARKPRLTAPRWCPKPEDPAPKVSSRRGSLGQPMRCNAPRRERHRSA